MPPPVLSDHSIHDRRHTRPVLRESLRFHVCHLSHMAIFQLRLLRARSSAIESRVFTAIRRQRARGGVQRHAHCLTSLLDVHAPYRAVRRSTRPSQDWFDVDCRAANSLERVYRRHSIAETQLAEKITTSRIEGLSSSGSRCTPDPTHPSWDPALLFEDPTPKL